jgi:hypothetical protein
VAWRFPDWKAVGSRFSIALESLAVRRRPNHPMHRFPGPVPRIEQVLHAVTDTFACVGSDAATFARSLTLQFVAPLAATLTPIAHWRFHADWFGVASSQAADPRRARTHCFARLLCEDRTPSREPFPISPDTFVPDDDRKYTTHAKKTEEKSDSLGKLSTDSAQLLQGSEKARCITRWKS